VKEETKKGKRPRFLTRGPLENVATAIIALGGFMLMQPYSMFLYSHSFKVILLGTASFVVFSHMSDD
jgi:hypothetical protein